MAEGLSIRAYAAHRRQAGLPGGTRAAVEKALRDGRIRRNARGKIDQAQADADWDRNTSPARQTTRAPEPMAFAGTGADYASARAVRELYAARLARLEFDEKSGALVSVDRMKVEIFRMAREVRDRMMAIPGRVAAQLAAETDTRAVRKILEAEIRKALESLGKESTP